MLKDMCYGPLRTHLGVTACPWYTLVTEVKTDRSSGQGPVRYEGSRRSWNHGFVTIATAAWLSPHGLPPFTTIRMSSLAKPESEDNQAIQSLQFSQFPVCSVSDRSRTEASCYKVIGSKKTKRRLAQLSKAVYRQTGRRLRGSEQ